MKILSFADSRNMDRKSIVSKSGAMDERKHGERDGSVDIPFVSGTKFGKIEALLFLFRK